MKSKVSRIRIPLMIRMTMYFILFGLIISYTTFIITISYSTREHIKTISSGIMTRLREISRDQGEDFFPALIGSKREDIAQTVRTVRNIMFFNQAKMTSALFYLDPERDRWQEIYIDEASYVRVRPATAQLAGDLATTCRTKMYSPQHLFFGKSDRVTMYINITPLNARNRYILQIGASRDGLFTQIRREQARFVVYTVFLLLISFVLGKTFARRITRPIKQLSEESSLVAEGDFNHRFAVTRNDEIGTLARSLNVMTGRIGSQIQEIERRVRTMETMNMIDKAVLSSISRNDLLDRVMGIVASLFRNSSLVIAMRDRERGGFNILSLYHGGAKGIMQEGFFIPDGALPPLVLSQSDQHYHLAWSPGSSPILDFYAPLFGFTPGSLVNTPIFLDERHIGTLVIARVDGAGYTPQEIESIRALADQVGVALHSVRAFEEKEKLLLGIMLALTRSIDAKSRWTAGHSERVAGLAEKIALRMTLGEVEIRTLTISAILHDIGKIAVPEQILDKPAKLDDDEWKVIKQHPSVGAKIIADIPSYGAIVPGILYHHEHWDGSGYPEGLRGEAIPVSSRIITLADVFDAITAERPYRVGMSRENALVFVEAKKGELFDPHIASLFIAMMYE